MSSLSSFFDSSSSSSLTSSCLKDKRLIFVKVDENTQAIPIDDLYNSISELPEVKEDNASSDDSSINDLYNSYQFLFFYNRK